MGTTPRAAMAGVGFDPAWTGAYRIIVAETSPQQRTGLVAAIFDVAYLFKSIPPIAGVATQRFGLLDTAVGLDRADCLLVAPAARSPRLHYPTRPTRPQQRTRRAHPWPGTVPRAGRRPRNAQAAHQT